VPNLDIPTHDPQVATILDYRFATRFWLMPATRYQIWGWGDRQTGVTEEQYLVGVTTRAKRASSHCAFTVVNEYVCQELGRMLGLPIPVGAILEREGVPYYASLDFNVEGQKLPPADAVALAGDLPDLSLGIVMFDIWIGNGPPRPELVV
jgi:hypothetical protein